MKKRKIFVLFVLFLSLLATSCSGPTYESTSSTETHIVTDFKDRKVTLKKDIKRVCITFNIEEYLAIAGSSAMDKIVGWSHSYWVGRREDALSVYTKAFPQLMDKEDIGYGGNSTLNFEKMIDLNPDVILMSASVDYSSASEKLPLFDAASIPVVFFDYHVDTKESNRKSNMIIGSVMQEEQRALSISDFYDSKVDYIINTIDNAVDLKKPNVYMEFSKGKDVYGNTWSKKMWGSLIGKCGGNNIAYNLSDANSVDMAKEAIIANNPDVIILTGALQTGLNGNVVLGYNQDIVKAKEMLSTYLSRTEWADIPAVKNQNMYALYHDFSRHVFDFVGVEYLAKCIHPELFRDLNPENDLKEFFAKYMPIEAKGAFMVGLK